MIIKHIDLKNGKNVNEANIAQFLSSAKLRSDPNNHCVPILDHFRLDSEPGSEFIVMPLLRGFKDPPFYAVDEVLDFVDQILRVRGLYLRLVILIETESRRD